MQDSEFENQPEPSQPNIPPPSGPNPDALRSQASNLRQVSIRSIRAAGEVEAPGWLKVAALFLFTLVISGTAFLTIFDSSRRQVISRAGEVWGSIYGTPDDHGMVEPQDKA